MGRVPLDHRVLEDEAMRIVASHELLHHLARLAGHGDGGVANELLRSEPLLSGDACPRNLGPFLGDEELHLRWWDQANDGPSAGWEC